MTETAVLLLSSAAIACGFAVVHGFLRFTAGLLAPKGGQKDHHEWANYVIASTQAAITGCAGAVGLLVEEPFATAFRSATQRQQFHDLIVVELMLVPKLVGLCLICVGCHFNLQVCLFDATVDTVHGHSMVLQTAMPMILGYFVYDLALAAFVSGPAMEKLMVVHHALCIIVWPISFHYQAGCFYILYMMAAELSTPFLWLVVYFLPRYKITGPVYIFLGLVMVLVFFVIRILPGPALLKSLISSQIYWKGVNPAIYWLAMITLPLPSLLFTYWFVRILQGMVGALASDKKD